MIEALTRTQTKALSNLLFDFAKILFGSVIVGFFAPSVVGPISSSTFTKGLFASLIFIALGLSMLRELNNKQL